MPKVPYQPYPDISPEDRPTPYFSGDAIAEAFGIGIGDALKGLGNQLERSGDELFGRALALQKVRNASDADEAIATFQTEAGKLGEEFRTLQGRNAPDAFPGYLKTLPELREKIRDSLPNDDARQRYNSATRGFQASEIRLSSGHSARQNKQFANDASKSVVKQHMQQIEVAWQDGAGFDNSMDKIYGLIDQQADIQGWGEAQRNHEKAFHLSEALSRRAKGMANVSPIEARQYLEQHRDKIYEQHRNSAESITQSRLNTKGASDVADNLNKGWAPWMDPRAIDRTTAVEPSLVRVVKRAQQILEDKHNIRVTIPPSGGARTPEEQEKLYQIGRRGVKGESPVTGTMQSVHLSGRAIDLAPTDTEGKVNFKDKAAYPKIIEAMREASEELGIPLQPKSASFTSFDPGHYELQQGWDTTTAPKEVETPIKDRVARGDRYAEEVFPGNTIFRDFVRQRTHQQYNQAKEYKREAEANANNILFDAAMGNRSDGNIPASLDELRSIGPDVSAAFDTLDAPKQFAFDQKLQNVAKAKKRETSQYEGMRLRGMAENDVPTFLSQDILNNPRLSYPEMKSMLALQQKKRKDPSQDPQMRRAMFRLGGSIAAAGIKKTSDPESAESIRYYRFTGALQDALVEFAGEAKKPPSLEELDKIGARLLREINPNRWRWFQSKKSLFEMDLSDAEIEKARISHIEKNPTDAPPTDEQVRRDYIRRRYKESLEMDKAKTMRSPGGGYF